MDTDRQTKSAETETDRQTDRQKDRQRDGQKMQRGREVAISTQTFFLLASEIQKDRQKRQTDTDQDMQSRQTGRNRDKQTKR